MTDLSYSAGIPTVENLHAGESFRIGNSEWHRTTTMLYTQGGGMHSHHSKVVVTGPERGAYDSVLCR
jgi:hypothetical protein